MLFKNNNYIILCFLEVVTSFEAYFQLSLSLSLSVQLACVMFSIKHNE